MSRTNLSLGIRAPRCMIVVLSIVLGSACASLPPAEIGPTVTAPDVSLGQSGYASKAPTTYKLRASDEISINVFREPELSVANVKVGLDGVVSLPLIGPHKTGGKTTGEVEGELVSRLFELGLKDPRVSVNILAYAPSLVTVEGAVEEAGVYPFQPGARLSSAIALAKGPSRVAALRQVAVFRTRDDGIYAAKFDYNEVSRGTMLDPVLEPGDRVVVGTSALSQIWQDTLRALPAFGIFTNLSN